MALVVLVMALGRLVSRGTGGGRGRPGDGGRGRRAGDRRGPRYVTALLLFPLLFDLPNSRGRRRGRRMGLAGWGCGDAVHAGHHGVGVPVRVFPHVTGGDFPVTGGGRPQVRSETGGFRLGWGRAGSGRGGAVGDGGGAGRRIVEVGLPGEVGYTRRERRRGVGWGKAGGREEGRERERGMWVGRIQILTNVVEGGAYDVPSCRWMALFHRLLRTGSASTRGGGAMAEGVGKGVGGVTILTTARPSRSSRIDSCR